MKQRQHAREVMANVRLILSTRDRTGVTGSVSRLFEAGAALSRLDWMIGAECGATPQETVERQSYLEGTEDKYR